MWSILHKVDLIVKADFFTIPQVYTVSICAPYVYDIIYL